MDKQEQITQLCKTLMYQKRSRLAHAFDFIGLRLLSLLILFFVFSTLLTQFWGAVALSIIGTLMLSIVSHVRNNIRVNTFTKQTTDEITKRILLDQLILMNKEDTIKWCSRLAWRIGGYTVVRYTPNGIIVRRGSQTILFALKQRHYDNLIMPQDILDFYHAVMRLNTDAGVLLSTAPTSAECSSFLSRIDADITLCGPDRVLKLAKDSRMLTKDRDIEDIVIKELNKDIELNKKRFDNFKKQILLPAKSKRYAMCGLIILIGGLIIGQPLYYTIFSSACFGLAIFTFFSGQRKRA